LARHEVSYDKFRVFLCPHAQCYRPRIPFCGTILRVLNLGHRLLGLSHEIRDESGVLDSLGFVVWASLWHVPDWDACVNK
jgi:hypothetical protein